MYEVERFEVGPVQNCTYVIADKENREAIVVDPAWEMDRLVEYMNQNQLALKALFLTHFHYDHTNLASQLVNKYQCKCYISKKEIDYYHYDCDNLAGLEDGQIIQINGFKVKCILTPGHTVGSMCFRLGSNLFTGDTLFIRSCGFCNCKGGDWSQLFESISRLKEIVKKEDIILRPGHYFRDDRKYEKEYKKRNIYLHIEDKKIFEKFVKLSGEKNEFLKYEQ